MTKEEGDSSPKPRRKEKVTRKTPAAERVTPPRGTSKGTSIGPTSPAAAEMAAKRAVDKLKARLQATPTTPKVYDLCDMNEPAGAGTVRRDRGGAFVPASFQFMVHPHDIAGGVQQLRANGKESSWMTFLFDTTKVSEEIDDRSLALQYSVAGGRVGLEWTLLGPRPIADCDTVTRFMQANGHTVRLEEMNDAEYLRVEDADLASLGERILSELYGVLPNAELGLLIDGLWLSHGKRTPL